MELDKRIIDGKKPLTAFDVMESKFIGTDCYFSDKASDYGDLSNCQIGRLLSRDGITGVFNATKNNSYANFNYCLPCEWVKPEEPEKKYRPYTVMEFIKEYPLGSHLHFRQKDKTIEMHRLIDGYNDCLNGAGTLFMCGAMYSMSELYDNYDIFKDGKWQAFGKESEE
jgi:hypothetical protein